MCTKQAAEVMLVQIEKMFQNVDKYNTLPQRKREKKKLFEVMLQFGEAPKPLDYLMKTSTNGQKHFSKKSLKELEPIYLNEMMLPKIHYGRYLICRTKTTPKFFVGLSVVVNDLNRDVEVLQLFNMTTDVNLNSKEFLPIGSILIIKEPYLQYGSFDNITYIRCDSPSDVIIVDETDDRLMETEWGGIYEEIEFDEFKLQGNQSFKENKFDAALRYYTKALNTNPKSSVIHLNIAAVLLKMERYEEAFNHARLSNYLSKSDKALYRMAVATYSMRKWSLALENYKLMNSDLVLKNNGIEKCEARLKESQTGSYNWSNMINQVRASKTPRLDYADYTGSVEIANVKDKGKCLVATKDVKKGELLMVSKAFSISYLSECKNEKANLSSYNSIVKKFDNNAKVLNTIRTIQNLYNDQSMLSEFYKLNCRLGDRNCEEIKHGMIDVGLIEKICEYTSFQAFDMNFETDLEVISNENNYPLGIWILPAYMNHSCDFNSFRSFYGDILTVHATRDIKKGDEITIIYSDFTKSLEHRTNLTQRYYNFTCNCALCEMDRHDDQYNRREKIIDDRSVKAKELLRVDAKKGLKYILEVAKDLKQTYEKRDKMKYRLIDTYLLLVTAYKANNSYNKAVAIQETIVKLFEEQLEYNAIQMIFLLAADYDKLLLNRNMAKKTVERAFEVAKTINGDTIESFKLRMKTFCQNYCNGLSINDLI